MMIRVRRVGLKFGQIVDEAGNLLQPDNNGVYHGGQIVFVRRATEQRSQRTQSGVQERGVHARPRSITRAAATTGQPSSGSDNCGAAGQGGAGDGDGDGSDGDGVDDDDPPLNHKCRRREASGDVAEARHLIHTAADQRRVQADVAVPRGTR